MTAIYSFKETIEQLTEYLESKENPDEWYVLRGNMVGEYSIWADEELSEDYDEFQNELPPEDQDANPNVDGWMQIGSAGWVSKAFDFPEDSSGFVSEVQWGDNIERNAMNMLVVHESVLSDEAIDVAVNGAPREAPADD
jgi:hypothetical protein